MIERVRVSRGGYLDSVSLLLFCREARRLDGVTEVAALAATPLNLELLRQQGFRLPGNIKGANDLVFAVRARDEEVVGLIDGMFREWSTRRANLAGTPAEGGELRNVRALARRDPDANILVVSVPGPHASYEVASGLEAGLNVFCFSSGMSMREERALKDLAAAKGLLLLGPDCGTAIIDGVRLGFGNILRQGPIGIVGASGTGIQEVSCLLDAADIGISHAIGVGSQDLSDEVGGTMTYRALDLLSRDSDTETIVIVAKHIGRAAMTALMNRVREIPKPVVLAALGAHPERLAHGAGRLHSVGTLEAAATAAAGMHGRSLRTEERPAIDPTPGFVRGLFCGGSLCQEAAGIAIEALDGVSSNVGVRGGAILPDVLESVAHTFLDLGDEALTQGRLHPMIDPTLRNERALREGRDPAVGVLLMDVVLGSVADPDPAASLVPLITELRDARRGSLTIVISICGTDADPQDLPGQRQRLERAGAVVTRGAAQAARIAVAASGMSAASGADGPVK